ncbi:hypothetical protein PYCCODRAFT_1423813 [Trametes coccinea BRFM310]|uniref:Uncharacterized protein n=1 Tax=Trametes coccinea (strain BRFM310) TaxID=1353009 RepID=A0A1Y2IUN6_TRAC3|nr:hypothetical protein PYCCODRAFT_1423813 [Trametes coccinea BRFM310]
MALHCWGGRLTVGGVAGAGDGEGGGGAACDDDATGCEDDDATGAAIRTRGVGTCDSRQLKSAKVRQRSRGKERRTSMCESFTLLAELSKEVLVVFGGAPAFTDLPDRGGVISLAEDSPVACRAWRTDLCWSQASFTHAGMSEARPRDLITFAAITPGLVLGHANGTGGDLALRARLGNRRGLFNDLHVVTGELINLRDLSLDLNHRRGGLVLALPVGALRRDLGLHLREGLAIDGMGPGDLRIDRLAFHTGRETHCLTNQSRGLQAAKIKEPTTYQLRKDAPREINILLLPGDASPGRGRKECVDFLTGGGAELHRRGGLFALRGRGLDSGGTRHGGDASRGLVRVGGVPLFADSGTIAANDVACQRSVVSALRTRAAITKRANAATTHDRAARPGERAQKRISLSLHLLRGLLQIAANLPFLHLLRWFEARELFFVFAEGFLQSHSERSKFAFDFAFERSHRAAKIFGASERGNVAGPGTAEDAYRRVGAIVEKPKTFACCQVHGFADFALRTEEAVLLDDQEGFIKGLTAKNHLNARRDRQKLALASIIRQDQWRYAHAKAANTYHAIVQLILCLKPLLARA